MIKKDIYNSHKNIQIKDLRPIGSKQTKICLLCGTSGRKLYTDKCYGDD